MKAIVYDRYGSPEVLRLEEVPKPAPADGEVLVRIHATSVNSWDWERLLGMSFNRLMGGFRRPKLKILGADVAGTVEAVGTSVSRFQPGDEVYGDLSAGGWGCFAEYVRARESALALKPPGMTFKQAAAIPQAGVLALQGLHKHGPLRPGQRVLINGAGGGVGTFAIQIAKSSGAHVTGVDKATKFDVMRSSGADEVIDYTREDFAGNGRHYDLILDVAAHRSIFDYRRALSPTGAYVMVGGSTPRILQILLLAPLLSRLGSKQLGVLMHRPNADDLARLSELFEAGKAMPVIDRCFPLSEVPDALRYFGGGRALGKIVISVAESA